MDFHRAVTADREITMLDVQALDGSEGFKLESAWLNPAKTDPSLQQRIVCSRQIAAPGAELAMAVVVAEAACLHQARKI